VEDAQELEPQAPGCCQSRVDDGDANPRFVVTSLKRAKCKPRYLYEKVYCARGDMENRIKECQRDLYADRTSSATMRANQLRLWFASMAYVLLCALRRMWIKRTLPTPPVAPSVSSCSRLALWCSSASAGSKSGWHQPVRQLMSGDRPPVASPPQAPAACPPYTRHRIALLMRHHCKAHRDRFSAAPAAQNDSTIHRADRCHP
jgi:Transposase DDE domain group 1